MKYFKFNHVLLILSAIFFAVIFWKFFSLLSFPDSGISFEGKSKQEKLYPDTPIIQKITATKNYLSQINVSVGKFSPKSGDKIVLEIADESCEKILTASKIDGFTWSSLGWEKFKFVPLPDSKDKTYCLKFTYVPKEKEQNEKASLSSYALEGSSYTNTGKSIKEQKNRTLELKPAYENESTWQNFSQLISRMSQYKPDYFKSLSLEIIFFLSFMLILAASAVIIFVK